MNAKQQIEEMAKLLEGTCDVMPLGECYDMDCKVCAATLLYNAGYRKQTEGEWKTVGEELKNTTCSVCGHWVETPYGKTPYCPNCGAKMKGGAE